MTTNCKNCGAPVEKAKCEYCGTNYGIKAVPVKKQSSKTNYDLNYRMAVVGACIIAPLVFSSLKRHYRLK